MGELLEHIEIESFAAKGKALARYDGKVIFVKQAVVGDVVDINIYRKKRKYSEAEIVKIHKYSDLRTTPFCEHFGTCGGCKWQNLSYSHQLQFKQNEVVENMKRIAKQKEFNIQPIIPSKNQQFYRNKLEYTFSNKAWVDDKEQFKAQGAQQNALGFHVPGRFDKVLSIDKCYLQNDLQNKIRNFVEDYCNEHDYAFYDIRKHEGLMRNLILKSTQDGQWMVILIFAQNQQTKITELLDALKQTFSEISSLYFAINTKLNDSTFDLHMQHYCGSKIITEKLKEYTYQIGPKSFFQVNIEQTVALYDKIIEFAAFKKSDLVYDLYCGAGSIGIYISKLVKKVIGIEYVEEAVKDAKENNHLNKVENLEYFAGDMHKVLTKEFIQLNSQADVVILDPPRAGMHPKVCQRLLEMSVEKIVYVSCNSATQARDIEILSSKYNLVEICPVDMFPHTHHVENVALLTLK